MAGLIPVRAVPLLFAVILGIADGCAALAFVSLWLLHALLARFDHRVEANGQTSASTPHPADPTLNVNGNRCVA